MKKLILIDVAVIASAMFLCGCNLAPLKGGRATTSGVIGQTVVQGDNSRASVPAGSRDGQNAELPPCRLGRGWRNRM